MDKGEAKNILARVVGGATHPSYTDIREACRYALDVLNEPSLPSDVDEAAEQAMPASYSFLEVDIYGGSEPVYSYEQMVEMFKAGVAYDRAKMLEGDLKKEIDSEWKKCNPIDEGMGVESVHIHIEAFDIIARHFAEWQYQKDREEFAKIKAKTWREGYNEGLVKGAASQRVKLFEEGLNAIHQNNPSIIERTIAGVFVKYGMDRMKEEMLKDAVEGKIYLGNDYCTYELIASLVGLPRGTYKDGDKVRIVVLKEEEE